MNLQYGQCLSTLILLAPEVFGDLWYRYMEF